MTRTGIGVSPGIAIAKVVVLKGRRHDVVRRQLAEGEVPTELARFDAAVEAARKELVALRHRAQKVLGEQTAAILGAHLLMLDDDGLVGETARIIDGQRVNAEWALSQVIENLMRELQAAAEETFRERARDVEDIGHRLQRNLRGEATTSISNADEEYILVAEDLAPSDAARLDRRLVKGIAVDAGGRTSHTGIIAKSLEIPAVVGLGSISRSVRTGDMLIIDGNEGKVIASPDKTRVQEYLHKKAAHEAHERKLLRNRDEPSVTADGHKIFLQANIDFPDEFEAAVRFGAEGIGLYRSEFLYLNAATAGPPSEDAQCEVYRTIAERVYPNSAIVRTIDFGGGKVKPLGEDAPESNPIMGLRAIRYCLAHRDVFKTQLRALLRASVHGRLKIMFPLISSVAELRSARAVLEEAKAELRQEKALFNDSVQVGIMIEVPAAAIIADLLAKEVDFFSIGTNDLIQFLLAIDRDNTAVSYLYEPLHPGVLRTLRNIIEAGHQSGIRVGMCGEMASDPVFVPLLVGLGLDEISMNAVSIPLVKRIIRGVEHREAKQIVTRALELATAREVEELVLEKLVSRFPGGYL